MLLIRADGNARIGVGHLMRCLTIAEEVAALQGAREHICFLCAEEPSAELVGEHHFMSRTLGTDYRNMESELPLWQQAETLCKTDGISRNVILVDSYCVTEFYLAELKKLGYVVLMDDLGRQCYSVDCVINYNAPASMEAYRELYRGRNTRLLIGSSYVPLRRQFLDRRRLDSAEEVRNVLITTGGGDVENIAGKILRKIYKREIRYHIVIGQFNPHYREMKELEEDFDNIQICHNVVDMAGLMCSCDIAVTAGGSTVYELAALGVPLICFSYAENQEALAEYIGNRSIACSAGAWHRDAAGTLERIDELFEELTGDREKRVQCSQNERAMVDGQGAIRLARALNAVEAMKR